MQPSTDPYQAANVHQDLANQQSFATLKMQTNSQDGVGELEIANSQKVANFGKLANPQKHIHGNNNEIDVSVTQRLQALARKADGSLEILSCYVLLEILSNDNSVTSLLTTQGLVSQVTHILKTTQQKQKAAADRDAEERLVYRSIFDKATDLADIAGKKVRLLANRNVPVESSVELAVDSSDVPIVTDFLEQARLQQDILTCPDLDDHILFMTALKILEKQRLCFVYPAVLKELLKKNVHKSHDFEIGVPFIGRASEIAAVVRAIHLTERNNVLLIGSVGVGKTALAKSVMKHITDRKKMQLFPGSDTLEDQVLNATATAESQYVFLLDELFSFSVDDIQFLMTQGQIVATASETAYRKFAVEQPAIISKCNVITLNEPTVNETASILQVHTERIEHMLTVQCTVDAVQEVMKLSKQYIHTLAFPAKAIGLLEESAQYAQSQNQRTVTPEMVKVVVSQKTNMPIEALTDFDTQDLSDLDERIKKKVKGQDHAIQKVARSIQRSRLGLHKEDKPIGSFLFVGSSGVGKTELAKVLAKEMFGDEENFVRLDMSEYSQAHTVQRLIGAPPGYLGYEEGGQLTNPVQNRPYSLILLDEIEKAHPKVFDIFLQVLDDGRLTDGRGQKVDFRNTLIIATSNAGIDDILDFVEAGKSHDEIEREITDIMQDYFRVEFLNRFDDVIVFKSLNQKSLVEIARSKTSILVAELQARGINLEIKDETIELLAEHAYDPRYGARGLERLIQQHLENPLVEMIMKGELQAGENVVF